MLFIGGNKSVSSCDLICILNYDEMDNEANRSIYKDFSGKNKVLDITQGSRPKSIIITENMLYLSAISSVTLQKRADILMN